MLGGDNIDLALAHHVEKKLGGARLDTEQWSALRFACRTAKEKLLGEQQPALERWPVTIAGRGSRIIGGSIQSELTRQRGRGDRARRLLPAGRPRRRTRARRRSSGFQEFGLPFVADPAVPKHLSYFLRRHRAEAIAPEGHQPDDRPARPDAILFNGGALTPEIVRDRIVEVIALVVRRRSRARRSRRACSPTPRSTWPWPRERRITESSGAAAASGSAAARRGRSTSGSRPARPTSPGSASCRATPRKAKRSRSPATTSTC